MIMRNQLLKEYIGLVVYNMLNEQSTVSTSTTTGTASTTSTTATTGATGTTSTTASTRTGTTGTEKDSDTEADSALSSIEDKVDANNKKIDGINANLSASRADATKMSTRTREMQAANKNIEKNMRDAADSTERLRDAGNVEQQKDAYNKTSSALKGVADNVGTIVSAQANVADILNRQGNRVPTESSS